jgi:type VI secretion system secreted protein Hcp
MAQVDYFLKIDGIEGESQDKKHKGEIEVESFSWGLNAADDTGNVGKASGKVTVSDFHFTMRMSKASPKLMTACATGQHIKKATFTGRRAGTDDQMEFIKIELDQILIGLYRTAGGGDELPMEEISLSFGAGVIAISTATGETSTAFIKGK